MALSTVHQNFICHFCSADFSDRSSLLSHLSYCRMKTSTKHNDETIRLPRLNKIDRDTLNMLKLHCFSDKFTSHKHKDTSNPYLQIPLSIGYISSSKQTSFNDSICSTNNSLLTNDKQVDQEILLNNLNKFPSVYHIYKYSRREQKNFYASVKRARLKKQYISFKKSRTNSLIFNQKNFSINLPTKIHSRQRLNTNSNNSYPLIFDPNFNSLVQKTTNNIFKNYLSDINSYFHLIHSIASQEFQIIVNSNDNERHISYTAFSFLNILRQTMADYSINLQKAFKRNYFQTFHDNDQEIISPYKIRRYNQPISSLSSIQIETNRRNVESQTDNILLSTTNINNLVPIENNNNSLIYPVQSNSTVTDHQQSIEQTSRVSIRNSVISIIEEQNSTRSTTPIILREQKIEPIQNDEIIYPIEKVRIRLVNESDNNNKKQSSSSSSSRKKFSNSINKIDENSIVKPTRMNTRRTSVKTEITTETCPSFETKPVILSSNEISKGWLTHTAFYRCHACSHEEFFVALSRECMSLHISSKHGNMEENFKQRLSNFLNNKGRSLKIFQHYLKWQQPWTEKEIEQIFKLSNK